jgi:GNAT superfamily N-acetyltransferase
MGLKLEGINDFKVAEEFFTQAGKDHFAEIFPPDVAALARKTFGRQDYFYVANNDNIPVGAVKFSIVGNVGQLDALVVNTELDEAKKEVVRRKLLEKFLELCHSCHRMFLWIPYQNKKAIGVYRKYGFEERYRFKNAWFANDYILMMK